MANTISAEKNARKAKRRHIARVGVKSELKTLRKKTIGLAEAKDSKEKTTELMKFTVKKFAKAASNGYIHPRTASRKIGRLMKQVHKMATQAAS